MDTDFDLVADTPAGIELHKELKLRYQGSATTTPFIEALKMKNISPNDLYSALLLGLSEDNIKLHMLDSKGLSALHYFVLRGNEISIRKILKEIVEIDKQNLEDMIEDAQDDFRKQKFYKSVHFDFRIKSRERLTPKELAIKMGLSEMTELLEDLEEDFPKFTYTLLDYDLQEAQERERQQEILRQNRAKVPLPARRVVSKQT